MEQSLFANKNKKYEDKLFRHNNRAVQTKKYTQKEILIDFLLRNPKDWYYIWELMGEKPLGWLSHKIDVPLSDLSREGKIEIKYIGKYAVYSIKQ